MVTSIIKANQIIEEKELQIEALTKKLQSSEQESTMLQHQVEQLLRRVYGRRSERLDPNQLMLDPLILQAIEQAASLPQPLDLPLPQEPKMKRPKPEKRNHPGRIPIPEHLERVEIILDIPEQDKISPETRRADEEDRLGGLGEARVPPGQDYRQRIQAPQVCSIRQQQ